MARLYVACRGQSSEVCGVLGGQGQALALPGAAVRRVTGACSAVSTEYTDDGRRQRRLSANESGAFQALWSQDCVDQSRQGDGAVDNSATASSVLTVASVQLLEQRGGTIRRSTWCQCTTRLHPHLHPATSGLHHL